LASSSFFFASSAGVARPFQKESSGPSTSSITGIFERPEVSRSGAPPRARFAISASRPPYGLVVARTVTLRPVAFAFSASKESGAGQKRGSIWKPRVAGTDWSMNWPRIFGSSTNSSIRPCRVFTIRGRPFGDS
jgi:hypothetical protein